MGQRTQIIVVHDLINRGRAPDIRLATAHHNQWGYGRPVCADLVGLFISGVCGKLTPYIYDKLTEQDIQNTWEQRRLLTHGYAEHAIDDFKLSGKLTPKAKQLTAMQLTEPFTHFDNNNGGALFWCIEDCKHSVVLFYYGCMLGPEESNNPFGCFIDGGTYIKKVNPQDWALEFVPFFEQAVKHFKVRLLKEDDTFESLVKNIKEANE